MRSDVLKTPYPCGWKINPLRTSQATYTRPSRITRHFLNPIPLAALGWGLRRNTRSSNVTIVDFGPGCSYETSDDTVNLDNPDFSLRKTLMADTTILGIFQVFLYDEKIGDTDRENPSYSLRKSLERHEAEDRRLKLTRR
jgi:hypothetical protein